MNAPITPAKAHAGIQSAVYAYALPKFLYIAVQVGDLTQWYVQTFLVWDRSSSLDLKPWYLC